jgi:hypothetical protein
VVSTSAPVWRTIIPRTTTASSGCRSRKPLRRAATLLCGTAYSSGRAARPGGQNLFALCPRHRLQSHAVL